MSKDFENALDGFSALGVLQLLLSSISWLQFFFIPGSLLTLGAGVIFGVLWGSIYVSIGNHRFHGRFSGRTLL